MIPCATYPDHRVSLQAENILDFNISGTLHHLQHAQLNNTMSLDASYTLLSRVLDRLLSRDHESTGDLQGALDLDDALLELETCHDLLTDSSKNTLDERLRGDSELFELARSSLDAALVVSSKLEEGLEQGSPTAFDVGDFDR